MTTTTTDKNALMAWAVDQKLIDNPSDIRSVSALCKGFTGDIIRDAEARGFIPNKLISGTPVVLEHIVPIALASLLSGGVVCALIGIVSGLSGYWPVISMWTIFWWSTAAIAAIFIYFTAVEEWGDRLASAILCAQLDGATPAQIKRLRKCQQFQGSSSGQDMLNALEKQWTFRSGKTAQQVLGWDDGEGTNTPMSDDVLIGLADPDELRVSTRRHKTVNTTPFGD